MLLSTGNIIHIFIPLWMQVSLWICSLHAQPCLLPRKVRRPQYRPHLLCMRFISIISPFDMKSTVNARRGALLVLFMNMCREVIHYLQVLQSPSVGTGRGVLYRINCFHCEPIWIKHIFIFILFILSIYNTQGYCGLSQNYTIAHI